MSRVILIGLIYLFVSCGQASRDETTNPEVSEKEIYDILKFVISDQTLDKNFGLKIQPGDRCDLDQEDKEFLTDLILQSNAQDTIRGSTDFKISIPLDTFSLGLRRCLTKEDVDYMLHQKETVKNFQWDNLKLGFNLSNAVNWYEFSIPLFSKDKSKAILLVSKMCKGLCGTEQTLLIEKDEGAWTSKTGLLYIH